GRELLAKRLTRRGFALSIASLSLALAQEAALAGVPSALTQSTIDAASFSSANAASKAGVISERVAVLTKGVLNSMWLTQLRNVAAVLALIAVGGFGAGELIYQMQAAEPPKKVVEKPAPAKPSAPKSKDKEPLAVLKYGDGKPDGKKSLGGSGELIEFT